MSRSFAHLLAKSTATPNEPRTHERCHILDVLAAARTLLHAVGHLLLGSFALPSRWFDVIEPAVARGALLNDLGNIFLSDARGINAPSIEWNLTVLVTTDRQASLDAGHANSIPGNAGPARNIFLDIGCRIAGDPHRTARILGAASCAGVPPSTAADAPRRIRRTALE